MNVVQKFKLLTKTETVVIPIQGGLYLVLFLKVLFLLEFLSSCRMNLGMMGCLHDVAVLQIRMQDMSVCVCVRVFGTSRKVSRIFFFSLFLNVCSKIAKYFKPHLHEIVPCN